MSSYFRLVKKFPLICIQDDKHLEEASLVIDELLKENLDDGGEQYLDARKLVFHRRLFSTS